MKRIIIPILAAVVLLSIGSGRCPAEVIFQDNFESDPATWKCSDTFHSGPSKWSDGTTSCGNTAGFGDEWKMGPGHNSNNAVYAWKKSGVPNGYRSASDRWLTGAQIKQEIYHRWYMNVPPAAEFDKAIGSGFKFWRYITRENGYPSPPELYLNVLGSTFATGNLIIFSNGVGFKVLTPVANFNDNQWHCHELRIKLNSNGASDGVLQYWLDGVLKATHTNLSFSSTVADLKIHRFSVGIGNVSDSDWFQTSWAAVGFDDIVVSTSYIGLRSLAAPTNLRIKQMGG
jgi:hypothetical protein